MKAYKKIISFILTLVMMLSLSVNVFAAEPLTDDPNMIEWKYTVFANESLQKVVEEGVIPNAYARYTWRGITLKNGEVAILTPSNNSMGLYCNSGRYITINYTLSRSAFHRSRVRAYVAGPSSEFVREITASGLRSGFTTQATDYYYGIRNPVPYGWLLRLHVRSFPSGQLHIAPAAHPGIRSLPWHFHPHP